MIVNQYDICYVPREDRQELFCNLPACKAKDEPIKVFPGVAVSYDAVRDTINEHNVVHLGEWFSKMCAALHEAYKLMGVDLSKVNVDRVSKLKKIVDGVLEPEDSAKE